MIALVLVTTGTVEYTGREPALVGETRAVMSPFTFTAGRARTLAERVAVVTTTFAV